MNSAEQKRNGRIVIANGAVMQMAMSFASSDTVLPAFVQVLTGSSVMVGVTRTIMTVGWSWPQVFVSRVIEERPRKMGMLLSIGVVRGLILALLAAITLVIDVMSPLYLACFFALYAVTSTLSGVTNVPWMDIIGKSVASDQRVRVFAMRRLWGGVMAIGSGLFISFVLSASSGLSFSQGYALLFLVAGIFTTASISIFGLIRERTEQVRQQRLPLRQYLASGVQLLRDDADYRQLLLLRYCWGAGMMGSAFYVPFAITDLGMSVAVVGLFVSVSQLSAFVSNGLWAWIGNRRGNCALMVYGTWFMGLAVLVPVLAPFVPDVPVSLPGLDLPVGTRVLFLSLAFFLQGFAHSGTFAGRSAFILDIAPADRRPTYTAFLNTFGVPQAALPIVGGALAAWLGYSTMFLVALAFAPIALLQATKLSRRS